MAARVLVDGFDGAIAAVLAQRLEAASGVAAVSNIVVTGHAHAVDALRASIRSADVLVTLVRDDWTSGVNTPDGLRRLVLSEAVLADVPIAPVLINDTPRPSAAQLPQELRLIADCEFHRLAAGSTLFDSIDDFIQVVLPRVMETSSARREHHSGQAEASAHAALHAAVEHGWRRQAELAERRRRERAAARRPGSTSTARGASEPPPSYGAAAPATTGQFSPRPAGAPSPGPELDEPARSHEAVRLGVSAPNTVKAERAFVARLVAYPADQATYARKLLRGPRRRSSPRLDVARCRWPDGAQVEVRLSGEHLTIANPVRVLVWQGQPVEAAFDVVVSSAVAAERVVLGFEVAVNGIPIAHPRLEVDVGGSARRLMGRIAGFGGRGRSADVAAPTSAFASYSSKDRLRVLDGVGALEAVGVDVFTDCLDLGAGERFKTRITRELIERDLYVLFWSQNARESEWVTWELDTVLDRRGELPVRVHPLEPDVDPPTRLSHLHFGSPGTWVAAGARQRV